GVVFQVPTEPGRARAQAAQKQKQVTRPATMRKETERFLVMTYGVRLRRTVMSEHGMMDARCCEDYSKPLTTVTWRGPQAGRSVFVVSACSVAKGGKDKCKAELLAASVRVEQNKSVSLVRWLGVWQDSQASLRAESSGLVARAAALAKKAQMVTVARPVKLTHKLTTMLHTAVHHHHHKDKALTRQLRQLQEPAGNDSMPDRIGNLKETNTETPRTSTVIRAVPVATDVTKLAATDLSVQPETHTGISHKSYVCPRVKLIIVPGIVDEGHFCFQKLCSVGESVGSARPAAYRALMMLGTPWPRTAAGLKIVTHSVRVPAGVTAPTGAAAESVTESVATAHPARSISVHSRNVANRFSQCNGGEIQWCFSQVKGSIEEEVADADIISCVEFNSTGELLATGDKGGRVVIFQRDKASKNAVPSRGEYNVYSTFQSHEPEFDYLKSLEIEEKINKIRWLRQTNRNHFLLSTNDKTIKLWKVAERDKQPKGYNLKDESGLMRDPANVTSLRVPVFQPMELMVEASPKRVFANAHTYHINSISVNSDQETYLSADDLRINLWNLEITDQSF
ncbi:hypothetical protein BaRGS_00022498, partial [Batillaria attramentaria]